MTAAIVFTGQDEAALRLIAEFVLTRTPSENLKHLANVHQWVAQHEQRTDPDTVRANELLAHAVTVADPGFAYALGELEHGAHAAIGLAALTTLPASALRDLRTAVYGTDTTPGRPTFHRNAAAELLRVAAVTAEAEGR